MKKVFPQALQMKKNRKTPGKVATKFAFLIRFVGVRDVALAIIQRPVSSVEFRSYRTNIYTPTLFVVFVFHLHTSHIE